MRVAADRNEEGVGHFERFEDSLTTEIIEAKKHNRNIDGVAIPAPYNKSDKVGYAIGALKTGRNQGNASVYLKYLATDAAQKIYAKYGFVKASAKELELRPIP